jgi:hypothetical protein
VCALRLFGEFAEQQPSVEVSRHGPFRRVEVPVEAGVDLDERRPPLMVERRHLLVDAR